MLEGLWAGQESLSEVAFPQSLKASTCRPSVSWFQDSSQQDGLRQSNCSPEVQNPRWGIPAGKVRVSPAFLTSQQKSHSVTPAIP